MSLAKAEIKAFLDENYRKYNNRGFIENDPVSIPHLFTKKEDIEIAGLIAATLAWGNRKAIIASSTRLMQLMDNTPYEFVRHHKHKDLKRFDTFVHRTFNGRDCRFFIQALQNIYTHHGGLESVFAAAPAQSSLAHRINYFRSVFLQAPHEPRSEKHISDPLRGSSAKRLCMYLRWMVRRDNKGVDFGLWSAMDPAELCLPLDLHTGNVSRALGLLKRRQNDWRAVEEITAVLRQYDPADPVKYDFALFGLGIDHVLNL